VGIASAIPTIFIVLGFERTNATVRWTVAGEGLTEPNHYLRTAQMQTNPDTPTKSEDCPLGRSSFFFCVSRFERPLRKHAGGIFLSRGRIH